MARKTHSAKQKTGSNAQERLLEAAVDVFGMHGFEAAKLARDAATGEAGGY